MDSEYLQRKNIELTNEIMPQVAREQHWPVRYNHCFQRIILDTHFEDCWYNHLDRSIRVPAYKQLTNLQLQQAIQIAQQMLRSPNLVKKLNRISLAYRNKLVIPTNS